MYRGYRIDGRAAPCHGEAGHSQAAELLVDQSPDAAWQRAEGLLQPGGDIARAEHVAQIDQHAGHVTVGGVLKDLLEQGRLPEASRRVKYGIVAARRQFEQAIALDTMDALLWNKRPCVDERVGRHRRRDRFGGHANIIVRGLRTSRHRRA